ncbi:GH3 family domain-containing protein [Aureitalea marina]|uniref:GH3 auxin-responsive promoter n=1 Tax=Aureitalea marina TaxID=930804 RepID=A0A2S7KS74_9FLAO|nr:GH3 auxin-responsive promoter family protein [Aureitalea marina]PQB05474.1 hypothetical protein BST85_11665 [Aureitalea marina]
MSLKALGAKIFARNVKRKMDKWSSRPRETQLRVLRELVADARNTSFGQDHHFDQIGSPTDFSNRVPIRDYEALRTYVDRMVEGEADVLWPGRPLYYAKTSGTTSGAKYIPISKQSMPYHIKAARNAILSYVAETGNTDFVDGKMIFLQGSPEMTTKNGVQLGRLSGIVAHYVPGYLQRNRMPSWETNCISDWEEKVDAIVEETKVEDMRVISGIPSWIQMYFERLIDSTGKQVGELFPRFSLFIYGGVNYEPYRKKLEGLIGRSVDSIELYPASEGFFAFQDSQKDKGMLLQLDAGIFYEFIPADKFFEQDPPRYPVYEVQTGVNYVMIISTNAGLWGYNLGDTVMFTSTKPYRVVVTGRIKHFISAFGEHVIGKEVETAMELAQKEFDCVVSEFTVAPQVTPSADELPYHEWLIEWESSPQNPAQLAAFLDQQMQHQNAYYFDLIQGAILQPLKITDIPKDGFNNFMKSQGKLGGQNKIPRLSNDRKIANQILNSDG